jgi:hypothetical protein
MIVSARIENAKTVDARWLAVSDAGRVLRVADDTPLMTPLMTTVLAFCLTPFSGDEAIHDKARLARATETEQCV